MIAKIGSGGNFPTPRFGFPYLSGAGRLVLKDVIMMAAGLILYIGLCKETLEQTK